MYEIAAQRINQYVEPRYIGDAMLRGKEDEILARELYNKEYAPVQEVGFVTNDKFGFAIGCSPDGLVDIAGGIEAKSRCQKYQVQTVVENVMPDEFTLQVQTNMLVTERQWWDFLSYSGGMPMYVKRILPDLAIQAAIVNAATLFEGKVAQVIAKYNENIKGLLQTERRVIATEELVI